MYDPQGVPVTGDLLVNLRTDGRQLYPCVAAGGAGAFVVAWESRETTVYGDQAFVYAQRFDPERRRARRRDPRRSGHLRLPLPGCRDGRRRQLRRDVDAGQIQPPDHGAICSIPTASPAPSPLRSTRRASPPSRVPPSR